MSTVTVAGILSRATSRGPLGAVDGRSRAHLERLVVDGRRYVLKRIAAETDWIMHVTGDTRFRPWQLWRSGLLDRLPPCIDHAVEAMELEDGVLSIVMRDVGDELLPPGNTVVEAEVHGRFFDHLAALHAGFWEWEADDPWLLGLDERYRAFAPSTIAPELAAGDAPAVVGAMAAGWARLPERAPELAGIVTPFLDDARPLVDALAATPFTFVHGDPNLGNLAVGADGRTILLDWAVVGRGPACVDVAHYLALNRARLPFAKEEVAEADRRSLERQGVATAGWWHRQLSLCLLGVMVMFGWEKALGDEAELAWWQERACEAVRYLP